MTFPPSSSGSLPAIRLVAALLVAAIASDAAVRAQARERTDDTAILANYPYHGGDASFHDVVGQSVQVYRLPFAYTLKRQEDGEWGAKLIFPVSFGLHKLSAEQGGETVTRRLRTLRIVPGVEFQVPVASRWTLYPSAEVGAGKDLEGGEHAFIYSATFKGITVQPWKRYAFRVGGSVTYDGATLADRSLSRGYTTLELGLDVRRAVSWTMGGRHADFSVYGMHRRFLPELEFEQLDGDVTSLRDQHELGLTIGVARPFRLWLLAIDRVGLGYRFGGDFSSVRLMFSAPF